MNNMKLTRFCIGLCALILLVSLVIGCGITKEKESPSLKPINVDLTDCSIGFAGTEVVYLLPMFKVSNPNEHFVSVDLSYTLYLQDEVIGASQVPTFYVPGYGEVIIRDADAVVYAGWFAAFIMGRPEFKSAGEIIAYITPLWKAISGRQPAMLNKEQWDAIKAATPDIKAHVDAVMSLASGEEGRPEYVRLDIK